MKKLLLPLFILLSFGLYAQTFYWSGKERIFDLQTDSIPVVVSGLPNAIDTTFGIAHICVDITHTYDNDLFIRLMSPTGMVITLIDNIGGNGDNFLGTCMGMDGTEFTDSQAPYTGLFEPVGDVSSFNNGQNPNGTWTLLVTDQANADTGTVLSVSLAFTNNPPRAGTTPITGPTGTYVWPGVVCPGGAAGCDLLPDMTSSAKEIQVNHNEDPGFLYISNATPNIGYGPIEIYGIDSCLCGTTVVPCGTTCPGGESIKHAIRQRIYQKVPGTDTLTYYDRTAGFMTYHPTHGHLHVDNWANYTLRTATSNPDATTWPIVGVGTKQSFCLVNLGSCANNVGECTDNNGNTITTVPNQSLGFHTGCGSTQGIYPGLYDVYGISLNDPIILDNVCNGQYYIVSITDPNNNFLESDETNNWVAVPITLTQQNAAPSISASGPTTFCLGDSVVLTASISSNYLWSTGDTTQSIVVTESGSYTVSSDCGTSVSTSSPVSVVASDLAVDVAATPNGPDCNGEPVQLNASVGGGGNQLIPASFTNTQQYFIPDNNSTGVSSPITVSGIDPGTLSSGIVVSITLNLTHTFDGDLAISLIAPSGNTAYLSNRRGGSGNNFTNTIFSMSASTLIASGSPPFTGTYKPDGNLNGLTGNVNGTWSLRVQDLAGADTGRIQNWTITLLNSVPETFTYSWTSDPPGFVSTDESPVDTPAAATTYYLTAISGISGCSGMDSLSVAVPAPLSISGFSPLVGTQGSPVNIYGDGLDDVVAVSIAGSPASFGLISSTQLEATVPNIPAAQGLICITNSGGCEVCGLDTFKIGGGISLQVKLFIEGFYLGAGKLQASVDPVNHPGVCDTIQLELHSTVFPYDVIHSEKIILSTLGEVSANLPGYMEGNSYYLVVRHRNALETWSSSPVLFGSPTNYDFTLSMSSAYGNNLSDLGDGRFGLFSGDVSPSSQDGVIEWSDYTAILNSVSAFSTGYVPEDLTGDGIVETADFILLENNYGSNIISLRP